MDINTSEIMEALGIADSQEEAEFLITNRAKSKAEWMIAQRKMRQDMELNDDTVDETIECSFVWGHDDIT